MISEYLLGRFMRGQSKRILRFGGQHLPPAALSASLQESQRPPGAATLYLHVPFCEQLCPYCSFNRVLFDRPLAESYFAALQTEMRIYAQKGHSFDSVYVGGGTPTVLPEHLVSTLRLARELWPIERISVETNPNHLHPPILDRLKHAGVNRLSVGVQSFQDPILRSIGRYQPYGSGDQISERLRGTSGIFDTLNVDMIFNFPGQDEQLLRRDLEVVRALALDQVTFYPLMAARNVAAQQRGPGGRTLGREKRFYNIIREQLTPEYDPSSAWCFSRKGRGPVTDRRLIDEYIVDAEEYAGLGSGSFGYLGGRIYANTFSIPRYVQTLRRGELPLAAVRTFSRAERIRYDFLMKMFSGALDLRQLREKYGASVGRELWKERLFFRVCGALRRTGNPPARLELNRKGYYFLVILMREFFTAVNNFRRQSLSALQGE